MHKEADKFEPRIAAAFKKSVQRLDSTLSIVELARVIHKCQQAMAMGRPWAHIVDKSLAEMMPRWKLQSVFAPLGDIVMDAYARGGKLGADHVNDVRGVK